MNQLYNMKCQCQQYLNQPVTLQVNGQPSYSGVVEHVDDENVYIMVPVDETGQYMDLEQLMNGWQSQSMYDYGQGADHAYAHQEQQPMTRHGEYDRYYAPGYYPYYPTYPPYAYYPYPYYPYPYGPYPRPIWWNRLILPLAALTAIAALR